MRPAARAALLALLLMPLAPVGAARAEEADVVERALAYLAAQQRPDGGWALPVGNQAYAVEAVVAAGRDPKHWPSPERSAYAALGPGSCPNDLTVPGSQQDCAFKVLLRRVYAIGGAGYDPGPLVQEVRDRFIGDQFGDPTWVNDDMWAVLALRAAGVPKDDAQVRAAVQRIREARAPDGGWAERQFGVSAGNTDMTGMALAALVAAGEDVRGDAAAKAFILGKWDAATNGFRNGPIGVNVQSTAWAIHAMAALGIETNDSALEYLRGKQRADGSIDGDVWRTTEALVVLAGERYPFPSYVPLDPPQRTGHVGETISFRVAEASRALWEFADGALAGTNVERTFLQPGTYAVRLLAETDATRTRVQGTVTILSARPVLGELPASVVAHRPAPLALDLSRARDPDGAIVAYEVDWGDGNVTEATSHAYTVPGSYALSVRARDDAGVWSHPATMRVDVVNRAPVLAPLPARILADRVHPATLQVNATDPDGDGVTGTGPRALPHATLGNTTVEIVVADAWGAHARANVTIEVVNLPPRVTLTAPTRAAAGQEIVLAADATDDDGPAPTLAWSTGSPRATFATGTHVVRVIATDADGATAEASATIVVDEGEAAREVPIAAVPPEIRALDAAFDGGALVVRFDADGAATLRWRTDAGEGERIDAVSPLVLPLDGATWASVELVVERDGIVASRESGLVVPPPAQTPASPAVTPEPPAAADAADPLVVAAIPIEPEPLAPVDEDPLLPAGVRMQEGPSRETPGPSLALALALALGLAAMRRRRAA